MKLDEYIPDMFDKRIRDGLEAAFDRENISVSEDLIQRTLRAIDKAAAEDAGNTADVSEGLGKRSKQGRNKVIGIVTTIAAGFILVFVGIRLVNMGIVTKESSDAAVMESTSSTIASSASSSSSASGSFNEGTATDTAAPDSVLDFEYGADTFESDKIADSNCSFAESEVSEEASDAGADRVDGTDNSQKTTASADTATDAEPDIILATISDMNDVLNGVTPVELDIEQYRLVDSYLIDKQLPNTEYEGVKDQPLFAAVYNDGEISNYIIVIDWYVLRVEYSSVSQSGVFCAYAADDPLLIAEELKLEIGV